MDPLFSLGTEYPAPRFWVLFALFFKNFPFESQYHLGLGRFVRPLYRPSLFLGLTKYFFFPALAPPRPPNTRFLTPSKLPFLCHNFSGFRFFFFFRYAPFRAPLSPLLSPPPPFFHLKNWNWSIPYPSHHSVFVKTFFNTFLECNRTVLLPSCPTTAPGPLNEPSKTFFFSRPFFFVGTRPLESYFFCGVGGGPCRFPVSPRS